MKNKYYCKLCNKEITESSKSGFCGSCRQKGIKRPHKSNCQCCFCKMKNGMGTGKYNPNYKGNKAKYNKTYYCIDCNKEITFGSILGRCKSCDIKRKHKLKILNSKGINNPNYGNHKIAGKNHPSYIDGRTLKRYYCVDCNKIISIGSKRCGKCWAKKRLSIPENNPNWKGGKSFELYALGWNNTFKEQIRYRDGYKCQICGCSEVENGKKLSVHHIDYNKKNIKENNLISLCISCHVKTNYNRNFWVKSFEDKDITIKTQGQLGAW